MKFVAFERSKQGTGASRRLRITGKTPGIVYGGTGEPQLVELDHNALWHALKKEAFHSSILDMELAGQSSKVLLRDVQYHPFKQLVLHVDFQRVDAKTKLHMKVPVHYSGQEQSPAVVEDGCLVSHIITELEVSCLPADLPEHISVDLSKLKKGALHLSEVQLPKGVTVVLHGHDTDPLLVNAALPAVVAEEEAPAAEAAPAAAPEAAAAAAAPAAAPAAKK